MIAPYIAEIMLAPKTVVAYGSTVQLTVLVFRAAKKNSFGHAKLSKPDRANWVPFLFEYVVLDQCIDSY